MVICVAVDNSVLGDITDHNFHENKQEDRIAFEKMMNLAKVGKLEIGIAVSAAVIEEQQAGEIKKIQLREITDGVIHMWPVVTTKNMRNEILNKQECLIKIMQDRNGTDSRNFIASTLHAKYFVMTDYRYLRQFNAQREKIISKCGITSEALAPSEFMRRYETGDFY